MDTRAHPTERPVQLAALWTQTYTVPAPPEGGGHRHFVRRHRHHRPEVTAWLGG